MIVGRSHGASLTLPRRDTADRIRADIERSGVATLRGLLRGPDLDGILTALRTAPWSEHRNPSTNRRELLLDHTPTLAFLFYLVADPRLHRMLEAATGCSPITNLTGRLYRLVPGAGHTGDFHNDLTDGRVVAFSLNLSERPIEGGTRVVRDAETKEPIAVAGGPDLRPGDALVLGLRPGLEHRVEEVVGTEPKTSFVGFLMAGGNHPLTSPRSVQYVAG